MRPRSIALTRHVRAASMTSCLLGLSSALPITERISSSSLSINFLASSLSSELKGMVWRHNLCRISSHCVVSSVPKEKLFRRFLGIFHCVADMLSKHTPM
uniref:Secreted protein n=1 Tax=Cyclopterus lumpus TaxID=8103 RepID=A0A8C3ATS5_CYCLU